VVKVYVWLLLLTPTPPGSNVSRAQVVSYAFAVKVIKGVWNWRDLSSFRGMVKSSSFSFDHSFTLQCMLHGKKLRLYSHGRTVRERDGDVRRQAQRWAGFPNVCNLHFRAGCCKRAIFTL
jgi:hypothetical protein